MKKSALQVVLVGWVLSAIVPTVARAAEATQTLTLKPGWNAVFLEVDPTDPTPSAVLAGLTGVESVWAWNPRTSPAEYVQSPFLPLEPTPYMLAYVPSNPLVTNLHAIRGETAYLVKMAAGAPATQAWSVSGEPTVPKVVWKPNSFNLVGFHLDPALPPASLPSYFTFFAGSPAHYLRPEPPMPEGPEVYVLDNASGSWRRAVGSDLMAPGEAFWVYCKGSSTFGGPLSVQLEQGTGLHFGAALDQQTLILRSEHPDGRTATVRALSGAAHLHHWVSQPDLIAGEWKDLFAVHPAVVVAAGRQSRLRLGVVRAGLTAGLTYEHNVEVTDGLGVRILLPASVRGISTAGLWVGSVTVNKVADSGSGSAAPTPVGSPFVFKAIVHVSDDATPQVTLLREVVQLWQEGTWKADPDNPGHQVVDQPGRFVLVANPALLGVDPPAGLRGSALRDGQEVGRRISTAAFALSAPKLATSGSFAPGSTVQFDVTLPPNDPANPFLHQYNKEHGAAGSYEVTRSLSLDFLLNDPAGAPVLGWGSSEVGGVYRETIGLRHANPDPAFPSQPDPGDASYGVDVEGTFRLRRVSDVGQLTTTWP